MLDDAINRHLSRWRIDVPPVLLYYFDRSQGETEEIYFIIGCKCRFESVFEFTAAALMAIAQRLDITVEDFSEMEVHSCEPASWMDYYDPTVRPGSMLCFPSIEILGFEPPPQLERKFYLVPHLSGTEESLVCESKECYVFLYWHTSG